jgi:hypothetical protein
MTDTANVSAPAYRWPRLYPEGTVVRPLLFTLGLVAIGAGVIGAIYILAEFGTVEIPTGGGGLFGSFETEEVTNPVAYGAAVGVFFNGLTLGSICIGLTAVLQNQARIMLQRNS